MMSPPCLSESVADLGGDLSRLESYLVACGYWNTPEKRQRHAYTLSPSAYVLTRAEHQELEHIAITTHAAVRVLNTRLCGLAKDAARLPNGDAAFLKLATAASRGLLRPHDGVETIPEIIKLDLVRNACGGFRLVEADVYNPRGLGYAALLAESVPNPFRSRRFSGISALATVLTSHSTAPWQILISEYERYYETAFRILSGSLESWGVRTHLLREEALARGGDPLSTGSTETANLFAIPESLFQRPLARDALLARYRAGPLRTFSPPVAYLGSKAFLPFLRTCEGMEGIIPRSGLVGQRFSLDALLADGNGAILKATVSSGMKGVFFSDLDRPAFDTALKKARAFKTPGFVLQEQIPQEPIPVVIFDEAGGRVTQDYYLRLTVYAMARGVLDAEVTGRPDRKVHGAPDCIQLPVIFS